jgi:eukaryotic-like serine/threonine-protein kinase
MTTIGDRRLGLVDTTTADPLVGELLDGRYQILARLARGGMATVYRALDTRLDREVAVKVLHAWLAEDDEYVQRFSREAKAAARLSHPNVVAVFDQGIDAGRTYLVMELVPGRTLRDVLRDQGRLAPQEALLALDGVLQALAAAHAAGLVHRDVKPENVMITPSGGVKVADFGLARPIEATSLTIADGRIIGSPAYLAPEQVETGTADARTDVYAAGIVLFELLTGTPPFTGDGALAVAYRHVNEDVPAPSSRAPLPRSLDDLCRSATARDPQARFQDAATMLSAVRRVQSTLPAADLTATTVIDLDANATVVTRVPPRPPTGPGATKPARPRRRRRALVVAIVMGLILGVAGGVGWWLGAGRYVETPRFLALDSAAATALAKDEGVELEIGDPVFSETVPKGMVAEQDPAPGDDLRRGDAVRIALSAGPDRVRVPNVVGQPAAAARAALERARLTVAADAAAFSDSVPEGRVIEVRPGEGTVVKPDTSVTLVVSRGRQPVKVPALEGRTEADAKAALDEVGLKAKVEQAFSEDVPKGRVISQSVAAGTSTFRGETVTLTVSKGPELVTVPSVLGKTREEAAAILRAANLKGEFFGPGGGRRRVFEQTPDAGERVRPGTTVFCYLV